MDEQNPKYEPLSLSELARRLAAQRRVREGTCAFCGTRFEGISKKRYCSHKCAVRAYRAGISKPYAKREEQIDGR